MPGNKKTALEYIENKQYKELRVFLSEMNPADIAQIFEELATYDLVLIFRLLPKELASEVFVYLENDIQERIIKSFSDKEIKVIVDDLFIDDMVDLIEEMPASVVKRILKNTDKDTRETINKILEYPDDSAGSIMTIEFVTLREEMTVQQAFSRIRETGVDSETIYTCYVTTTDKKLEGIVSVKELLLNDYSRKIADIMETNVICVNTLDDKEFVVNQMKKYDFLAMPVTDKENRLVGIVTYDDAFDVIEEETEEDFAKMAAMTPSEESYFKTSVFEHAKNRIPWLLFLMLSATLTGIIITKYENAFASVPILVAFIPMLMDTGGNCGSQSSTLIIRGLALEDITFKDIFKVIFKEIRISFIVGVALAIVNSVRIYIMYQNEDVPAILLALVVGVTLVCVVMLAKLIGSVLPMLADKIGLDPALMASPLITTIVDTCSVLIFFNIAMNVLSNYVKG